MIEVVIHNYLRTNQEINGVVAEWTKAAALKAEVSEMAPWVRILPTPPFLE